jgi:phage FluMu protein Com
MKVLKPQKHPPGSFKLIWNCSFCEAQLEAEESDLKMVYDQRDGDYVYMTCPECKGINTQTAKEIPVPVRRRLSIYNAS